LFSYKKVSICVVFALDNQEYLFTNLIKGLVFPILMKHPLYFTDCYLKEFTSKISSVKDEKYIVLEDTAFYPTGGGQPYDTGKLIRTRDNKEFLVVSVSKFNGIISHEIKSCEDLKEGDEVKGIIDWNRRYRLMRMHTAAHILNYVFLKDDTTIKTTGNQLEEDKSRIDFRFPPDFDKATLPQYEKEANEIIQKETPIHIKILPREKALTDPAMIKLAKGFDENIKEVRLLEISGYDIQPCGGTHLHNCKEIGHITFLKFDNRGAGNKRLYFTVDD